MQADRFPCDETGASYKNVVNRTDITKQTMIEAEIWARKADVEAAHHELEKAQSDLLQAEKLASIGTLAAAIAYEINTSITRSTRGPGVTECVPAESAWAIRMR